MSNGTRNPSKDPLKDIKREIDAAESRSSTAATLMDLVIAEGRNPKEDEALIVACETVQGHMKEARRLIQVYQP